MSYTISDEFAKYMKWAFVAPPEYEEQTDKRVRIKDTLLQCLVNLQQDSKIPIHLKEEAQEAHLMISLLLDEVWVKSFEDEEETKPKEVDFQLRELSALSFAYEDATGVAIEDAAREEERNVLAAVKRVIEAGDSTEELQDQYNYLLECIASPIVDTNEIAGFAAKLVHENFGKQSVLAAMQFALLERKGEYLLGSEIISRLYPNSKTIDLTKEFGLAKSVADNLVKVIQEANRESAIKQYTSSGSHEATRKPVFRTSGRNVDTEFIFDKEKSAIKTADQFANQLMKVRDAKVLQTFFALNKWANMKDTSTFREVPLSEIMSLVLKSNDGNKFNKKQRQEFSEVLEYIDTISITASIIGDQVNTKTGKSKPALRVEKGVKLFRLIATYSVKKEYQTIPKESLIDDIHFDKSVITSFSGELFPNNSWLFTKRAAVYFDNLLTLDANHDSKAILLGFQLQTRFNQLTDKDKCIELDRGFLIDLCDYSKTDKSKPSKATKQLANNLNKLKEEGIIAKYSGLTNINTDRVKIFPPTRQRLKTTA